MKNKSERSRVLLIAFLLMGLCLVPFGVAPAKDWYIILIILGLPTISLLAFGLLSSKLGSSSNPKRLWSASYFAIAFVAFCSSATVLYLTNYSWKYILLYSAGFGVFAAVAAMISIFVWSKIKQSHPSRPE